MSWLGSGVAPDDLIHTETNRRMYQRLADTTEKSSKAPIVKAFWKYLLLCFETPRPSTDYCEPDTFSRLDKIRQALLHVGSVLGAEALEDAAGNVIIRHEGRGAGVSKPSLCLQGHLDVVVSQNDGADHNFETDPVEVRFSSDHGMTDCWLKAVKETTLGADNGFALAAALAALECVESHPPLELLFTANEETNFYGAENLAPGTLHSKRLLNLDTEDEYAIFLGSAGIFEHHYKLPIERDADVPPNMCNVSVKLVGLHGGHSGVDINKEYGNANKLMARLLLSVSKPGDEVRLVSLAGGSGPTAISREASCVVLVPKHDAKAFCDELSLEFSKIQEEHKVNDPKMELQLGVCAEDAPELVMAPAEADPLGPDLTEGMGYESMFCPPVRKKKTVMDNWNCSRCEKCVIKAIASGADIGAADRTADRVRRLDLPPVTAASTRRVLQFSVNVPSGVLHMSTNSKDLVDSSINFGVVTLMDDHLFCHLCARSSVTSFLQSYQKVLSGYGELAGATNVENICPGSAWQPNYDSNLLVTLKRTHVEEFDGKEPHVTVIHAGLEPGVLLDSHPDLDCCSIGPQIENAHSPDECVSIPSAERCVQWLKRVLETLAQEE